MLSRIAARSCRVVAGVKPTVPAVRFVSYDTSIPSDRDHQTGRRKEEMDAEEAGGVGFNREPIIPSADAGTKENPILVCIPLALFNFSWKYVFILVSLASQSFRLFSMT